MKSDLNGKVSLVTGAARGIGKAIADRFAANGSIVYYSDRDVDDVRAAAGSQRWMRLDVTDPAEITAACERIKKEAGRLDVLVNNAGVNTLAHRVPIDQFPRSEWDRILAVDLTGIYEMSRAFAADHARAEERPHHQHRQYRRTGAIAAAVRVRGRQGGRGEPHQGDGARTRAAGHPRQRHRPRLDADRRHAQALLRRRRHCSANRCRRCSTTCRSAGPAKSMKSRSRRSSWPIRRTPT